MTAILLTATEANPTLGQVSRRADALGAELVLAGDLGAPLDLIRRLDAELTDVLREEAAGFEALTAAEAADVDLFLDGRCSYCGGFDGCLDDCSCGPCQNERALDEDADRYFDCD